jgi:hypothetical protein
MSLTAFTIAALDGKAPKAAKATSINRYLREAQPGEKTDQVQIKLPRKAKKGIEIRAGKKSMAVSDFVRQIVIYGRRELLK